MDKIYDILEHKLNFNVGSKNVEVDLRQAIWPCSTFAVLYFLFGRKSGFKDLSNLEKLKPQKVDEENEDDKPYEPKPVNIPALKGWMSVLYRKISRSPFGRTVLMDNAKSSGDLKIFEAMDIPEKPTLYPVVMPGEEFKDLDSEIDLWKLIEPSKGDGFHFNTISDYVNAYRSGTTTPLKVAENVINAIKDSESMTPKMRIMIEVHEEEILQRATESTARWKENKPLSVFDGIPIAVKDELFLGGYPCRAGLPIKDLEKPKSLSDEGWMVRKLREGGAVFLGICNMHQLGVNVYGINPSKYHGTCRNPYNFNYPPGGSSSGPASAVASGLCPIALGADGGGSIRIPSGICGIVGAKVSYGRISGTGFHANCDTIGVAGPLCATIQDAVISYGFLAGPDPNCATGMGQFQPPPSLQDFNEKNLKGIKIGIDWNYFNDSNPEIVQRCKAAVEYLLNECSAEIVEISIPEMQECSRAYVITVLSEMYTYGKEIYHNHHDEINVDTEMNFSLGESFSSSDYFQAQKQRTRGMNVLKRLFKNIDCIITPTFGEFMPELTSDLLRYGYNNLQHTSDVIRYVINGNFCGNPSISVPVGYSSQHGLPIGLLIHTSWWREDLMYRIGNAVKDFSPVKKPRVYYDILSDSINSGSGISTPSVHSPMI